MRLRLSLLLSVLVLSGCGQENLRGDAERAVRERTAQVRADVQRRADALGDTIRARRRRIVARIEAVLGDLRQIIPEARVTRPEVQRRAGQQDIEQFLTGVIESVDAYWTRTLRAAGRPAPAGGLQLREGGQP